MSIFRRPSPDDRPRRPGALGPLDFSVRALVPPDHPACASIDRRSFPDPWPESAFSALAVPSPPDAFLARRPIDHPAGLVAVRSGAMGPGSVLGFLVYTPRRRSVHLDRLAVAMEWRRMGMARALVGRLVGLAEGWARASKGGRGGEAAVEVRLCVRETNDGAIAAYRRMGFRGVTVYPGHYGPGEDAIVMSLAVAAGGSCEGR
jgi:ribosomal-protein-alanine N-acetyltransferase